MLIPLKSKCSESNDDLTAHQKKKSNRISKKDFQ